MSKARTIGFLVHQGILDVGDSFRLVGETFERIISEIDYDNNEVALKNGAGVFGFSEKVYPNKIIKKNESDKEYTISFKVELDMEYVDNESFSFEEALSKFRSMKPWVVITKSKAVDHHTDPEIFAITENEK